MNWKSILCLVAICSSFAFCYADGLPSFLVVRQKERGDFQNNYVLYPGESFSLAINTSATLSETDLNRNDLFAVRFVNTQEVLPKLPEFGKVLFVSADQHEAIMSVTEDAKIDALAAFLHEHSGVSVCGAMLKLMPPVEAMNSVSVAEVTAVDELVQQLLTAPVDPKIKELTSLIEVANISQFVEQLSAYKNRYHRSSYGQQSTDFIHQSFNTFSKSNPSLTVNKMGHSNTPQPSVIASLKGTTNPDEIVIVGCHIDSVNSSGGGDVTERTAPGADDNASGTAAVKEILRVLSTHNYRFKRTIEFHGYAAEEIGLVGSANVASAYKSAGKKVVGMVQIDMCMFVNPGATPKICIVSNDTDSTHNELAKRLVEQYTSIGWTTGQLFAGTSDHRSWTQRGYRAIFPFEQVDEYNHSIHTSQDNIGKANFVLAENMAKLALAYLVSIAEIAN